MAAFENIPPAEPTDPALKRRCIAGYIEELVREMETLAKTENLPRLSDLLRAAREEARRTAVST